MRNKLRTRTGLVAGLAMATVAVTAACGTSAATTKPPVAVPAKASALPSQQEVAGLFDTWNAALTTGDPQRVADLYAPDAVLLPTVSNKVRTNRAEIVDYFEHFLENKPHGVIEQQNINVLDADTTINTGVYRFTLTQEGRERQVTARYTYVYENRNGKWLIVNHHSSAMPEN